MEVDSAMSNTEATKTEYLARVARADQKVRKLIEQQPELDYSLLLHTFLCLDLTPAERLRSCLQRYGHCRF